MERLYVYWETPVPPEQSDEVDTQGDEQDQYLNRDSTGEADVEVHQGFLTTGRKFSPDGSPVLVEEVSERVYMPSDLPAETLLFVETAPGKPPALARLALAAGFHVVRADTGRPLR